jgi:hypothetical protein
VRAIECKISSKAIATPSAIIEDLFGLGELAALKTLVHLLE